MKRILLIPAIVAVVVAPLLGVYLLHDWLNQFYSGQQGVLAALGWLLALWMFFAQLLYIRSEKFYLLVHRVLLPFRRTHTIWRLHAAYGDLTGQFGSRHTSAQGFSESVLAEFRNQYGAAKAVDVLANHFVIVADERDRFEFTFNAEEREAAVRTSKMLVPGHLYSTSIERLIVILHRVERELDAPSGRYRLEVSFDRNPFFGFFVRHVPRQMVDTFHCSFRARAGHECRIEATKDSIFIDCDNAISLLKSAREYLSLAPRAS